MFDTTEVVPVDAFNTPTATRTVIGHLVACPDNPPGSQAAILPAGFFYNHPDGSLVVYNSSGSLLIPPDGTVVAVAAVVGGVLQELDGTGTTDTVDLAELEIPINEEDFFRDPADTAGVDQ